MANTASATTILRLSHAINVKSDGLPATTERSLLSEQRVRGCVVTEVAGFLFVRRVGAGDRTAGLSRVRGGRRHVQILIMGEEVPVHGSLAP